MFASGTDSTIIMHLEDANGRAIFSKNLLNFPIETYERGRLDTVTFSEDCVDLDDTKLRVEHQGQGSSPKWYLNYVKLSNDIAANTRVYKYNQWLHKQSAYNKDAE